MKRNETKTRTVWYFRMDDKDIKAFNNLQDACGFARDYLSKKFGKMYSASRFEDGSVVFSSRVVETKVVGSSSYPEMVNARYEDSLKATEPVVEESKPSGQIVWRYKVQFKKFRKQGRLLLDIPIAGWLDGGVFETKEEAEKSAKVFMRMPTRIRKVGELI